MPPVPTSALSILREMEEILIRYSDPEGYQGDEKLRAEDRYASLRSSLHEHASVWQALPELVRDNRTLDGHFWPWIKKRGKGAKERRNYIRDALDALIKSLEELPDPPLSSTGTLNWLHLSDLHQGLDGQGWLWPNVRELFYDDLARLHDQCGPWHVVFFTGDLTQKGSKEEFQRFSATLDDLWKRLRELGSTPALLAVPGNHDLVRPNSKQPEVKLLSRWNEDSELQEEFWKDPSSPYRGVVNEAFQNYVDWSRTHTLPRPQVARGGVLPGDFSATVEVSGIRIGVLGLNSAFLQLTGSEYEGKLALGAAQFHGACDGDDGAAWVRQHDLTFLLTHHPPAWLGERAQKVLNGEIASPGRFAAHLFGHMHEGEIESLAMAGAQPWRRWQGYSLFGLEKWADQVERRHGYTAGQLQLDGKHGALRMWPRTGVQRRSGVWSVVPDVTAFELESDGGTAAVELLLKGPVGKKPSTAKAAPTPLSAPVPPVTPPPPTTPGADSLRMVTLHDPADARLFAQFRRHLTSLVRSRPLYAWDPSQIAAGSDSEREMTEQLEAADVVTVLVSADLIGNDSLYGRLGPLLARRNESGARVIPVILRPCDWQSTPLGPLTALPRGGTPITSWTSPDEGWVDVVAGLKNVLSGLVRERHPRESHSATRADTASHKAPAISAKSVRVIPIGDIFRTTGQPDVTFVEPSQMQELEVYLRTMAQGLVIEGPSGIGKTTAVRKALDKVRSAHPAPALYLTGKEPGDVAELDARLKSGFKGHLLVDDFHHLDAAHQQMLASRTKSIADKNQLDSKITMIGINPVGDSLVAGFPDLAGRFVSVSMETQPREKIDELIRKGEEACNVVFRARQEFVEVAAGSFFTAQQLCLRAAIVSGITETQKATVIIEKGPSDVKAAVLDQLRLKYHKPLTTFASTDGIVPPRGGVLALLWLLSQAKSGHVSLHDARLQFQQQSATFDWLVAGGLDGCLHKIPHLSDLFFYQTGAAVLSAEDPQLKFYLKNMEWSEFAVMTGNPTILYKEGQLVFP